jgi:(1->4)-alpha-D-glucan 1-alpha-D-glucosylmutase
MRVPASTYRIQFHLGFRFADARELVPYLHELGVSDLYASPRFKARKGSEHGYDVADPWRINSELGTEEEFAQMAARLGQYSMGLLLDIVPNHMSASSDNPWWMDVLTHGPGSRYAHFFDIDWHPATSKAAFLQENRILLAVLGDLYGSVLERQELTLALDDAGLFLRYWQHRFPLDPKSYREPLALALDSARRAAGEAAAATPAVGELAALVEICEQMPARTAGDPGRLEERRQLADVLRQRLWQLHLNDPAARAALDEALRTFNGVAGEPASFDRLDRLLDEQAYRLAFWKIGAEEINYRRFFDINELVGLRNEDPEVFEARHASIIELVRAKMVTGLRVDHVDGLYDPRGYLERLQAYAAPEAAGPEPPSSRHIYVVVEKILGGDEELPAAWPVAGTTGYDFLNAINGMFLEPTGVEAMEAAYARITGARTPFAEVSYARNHQVMQELFAGEVNSLGHHLGRIAAGDRHARDLPLAELAAAIVEVSACLPVYRTYIREGEISAQDRAYIERALADARRRTSPARISDAALDFLRRVLLLSPPPYGEPDLADWLRFVQRWQQFTGPVMAKGLEDTAFYVHNSLVSLNEVGGDIQRDDMVIGTGPFHSFNLARRERWPASLNATATHDTKRGEDVRARINVLAEMPTTWEAHFARWHRWNQAKKRSAGGGPVPTLSEEVLLYQTLLGIWPLDESEIAGLAERLRGYMVKAAREAKTHTSWLSPSPEHEAALEHFVDAILKPGSANRFLADFLRLEKTVAHYGALYSLGQTLAKITAPGVPDFYQGTELWDFSLVDPDNRRPVDFPKRAALLEELKRRDAEDAAGLTGDVVANWPDGRIKMFLTWKALGFRREWQALFADGDYIALEAAGRGAEHVCAFARRWGDHWAVAVIPRQLVSLVNVGEMPLGRSVWGQTALLLPKDAPLGSAGAGRVGAESGSASTSVSTGADAQSVGSRGWRNVLTGERVPVLTEKKQKRIRLADALASFPVALLTADL